MDSTASGEESEEDLPVYQMMTTTYHVGQDDEDETSHVTMWKVRIFQEGNELL